MSVEAFFQQYPEGEPIRQLVVVRQQSEADRGHLYSRNSILAQLVIDHSLAFIGKANTSTSRYTVLKNQAAAVMASSIVLIEGTMLTESLNWEEFFTVFRQIRVSKDKFNMIKSYAPDDHEPIQPEELNRIYAVAKADPTLTNFFENPRSLLEAPRQLRIILERSLHLPTITKEILPAYKARAQSLL